MVQNTISVSSNSTDSPNSTELFDMRKVDFPQFVINFVVQFLLLAAHIYALAAFGYFVRRKRKSKQQQNTISGNNRSQNILIALLMAVTIAGILRIGRYLILLFLPNYSPTSSLGCLINYNYFYILFVAGMTALYFFLWYRQHTICTLPTIKMVVPKWVAFFSNFLLIFMFISAFGFVLGLFLTNPFGRIKYVPQTQTCVYPATLDKLNIVTAGGYVALVFFQASLLFCFVYVLRHHQANMNQILQAKLNSSRSLQLLMRNCVYAATICMITDITSAGISFAMPKTKAHLYDLMIYDLDYLINLMSAVVCFSNWKDVIDPWSLRKKIKRVFSCNK